MLIRQATQEDIDAIDALMAPEIEAGTLLDRSVDAHQFLVACLNGKIVGTVALRLLTNTVAELCSLTTALRGEGLGRRLVDAAIIRAQECGFRHVVAISGTPEFFHQCKFRQLPDAPVDLIHSQRHHRLSPDLARAGRVKAQTCRFCPKRMQCRQSFLERTTWGAAA
jgi:N-acetylglutamate synthase-like GNAT family acetyltransferase